MLEVELLTKMHLLRNSILKTFKVCEPTKVIDDRKVWNEIKKYSTFQSNIFYLKYADKDVIYF